MNDTDYRTIGLTLDKMGLRGIPPEHISTYARTRERPTRTG
jgi:hypothetical protein